MKRTSGTILGWLLVTALLAGLTAADDNDPATQPDIKHRAEVGLQRYYKKEFEQLTAKMVEIAELLEKSEPQTAKVLREAVSQAQRAFIAEDMEKVAQYLAKGLASAAASTESEVIGELRKVLQTLRTGILDLDERRERIRKWREFLGQIDKLLDKQRPLERQSNLAANTSEFQRRMDNLDRTLADIVAEQKKLRSQTTKLPAPDPHLQKLLGLRKDIRAIIDKQTKLREVTKTAPIDRLPISGQLQRLLAGSTDRLAEGLSALAKDPKLGAKLSDGGAGGKGASGLAGASKSAGAAAEEMRQAAKALGRSNPAKASTPQDQALADLEKVRKAIDDAVAKLTRGQKAPELAGKQGDLSDKTSQLAKDVANLAQEAGMGSGSKDGSGAEDGSGAKGGSPGGQKSGNLNKAAEHMKNAARDLADRERDEAVKQQDKALAELEAKKYEIARLRRRMMEKAAQPTKPQAGQQGELADRTGKLGGQMKKEGETPGQKSVAQASKSMGSASQKLGGGQCGGANADQKKAIDKLEQAREELADAVAQEEALAQAEQLAKIDQMLQKVLDRQVKISGDTRDVHGKRRDKDPPYARAEQIELGELSRGEGRLAEDVKKVRDMLVKEDTTVVFPEVLKEVRSDLQDVQKLLAEEDAGALTQGVQKEIEQSLREMISSIRDELAERRRQGGGGRQGRGGGGKQPLVPPIAEFKLVRALQLAINRRTRTLNKQLVGEPKPPADQAEREHKKLGRRQEAVQKMVDELSKKMTPARRGPPADSF